MTLPDRYPIILIMPERPGKIDGVDPKDLVPHLFPMERVSIFERAKSCAIALREQIKTYIHPERMIEHLGAQLSLFGIEMQRREFKSYGEPLDEVFEIGLIQDEVKARKFLEERGETPYDFSDIKKPR